MNIVTFMSLFLILSSSLFGVDVIYSQKDRRIEVSDQTTQKKASILTESHLIRVARDLDRIYLLDPNQKRIKIINFTDLFSLTESGLSPYREISINDEFSSSDKILDIAVQSLPQMSIIHISFKNNSTQNSQVLLKSFASLKAVNGNTAKGKSDEQIEEEMEINANKKGLFVLKSLNQKILGN